MRILVDPGSHHLLNAGDVAMTQVCVRRLQDLWPGVEIAVLTTDAAALAALCPGVQPVDATGRYALVDAASEPHGSGPIFDPPGRGRVHPRLRRAARRRRARRAGPAAVAYLDTLAGADLFAMGGRGGLTDAFADEARATLGELELARALGTPAVLLGQGVGPLEDARLLGRAAGVLPSIALASVREGLLAPQLLASLGVPADRIHVTGDDAVEPAHASRPAELGGAVGLNVRVASYSGVDGAAAEALTNAVAEAAAALGAETVAVPISVHPDEDDRVALGAAVAGPSARAASARGTVPGDPAPAIAAAGRCRVLVTGSYHAAVFALAQGVPAVAVAASPYYAGKFAGLAELFGDGVAIVAGDAAAARAELERLWSAAPDLRRGLLAAAARQVDAGRAAYRALGDTLAVPAPPLPASA